MSEKPMLIPALFSTRAARLLGMAIATLVTHVLHAVEPAGPQTARVYLSGTDKDHTVPWDFCVSTGRRAGEWTTLPVPSCWETKGFGTYRYHSWGPEDEYGQYRRTFNVPADWAGRRVFLVFEGSMTETELWVNGLPAGAGNAPDKNLHQGGFVEFSREITDEVRFGSSNLLEVTVRKISGDPTINNAERKGDYWNFGGIFRPVYLEARPAVHLVRFAVDARQDGAITVDAFLSGPAESATVAARVTTLDGKPVGSTFTAIAPADANSVRLVGAIPGVRPWSPEFPDLYRLVVELRSAQSKKVVHTLAETIGFRTVAFVKSEGFYLNGHRIRLKGTVHHEFWPSTGRTASRDQTIADLELMKAMGMNTVRRAHYPASREFYEEADRIGLLVLDELSGWQNKYGDTAARALCREFVIRDVNHPCVIAWDNGNEGGWNTAIDGDFDLYDPQNRIVIHPANWNHEMSGLKTHHYADYKKTQGYLGTGKAAFMPTENLHGLFDGGAGAGLHDYWEAFRQAPNGAGLLIWAFLDEGVVRDDKGGRLDVAGEGAPDGILGPYREKEASFYTIRSLWCPVQITTRLSEGDPTLTVENRFDFTNLAQCSFLWQLGRFPDPTADAASLAAGWMPAADTVSMTGPSVAPGATGRLTLAVPAGWRDFDALRLTATDPHGRELYTWTWPLRTAAQFHNRIVPAAAPGVSAVSATTDDTQIVVTAGPRVFRFDRKDGRLLGVTLGGKPVSLANGPRPVTGSWNVDTITHTRDGADYVVTVNDPATSPDAFRWRVRADGWLHLDYRYTLTGDQPWLGVTFDYPEEKVTGLTWLGRGPTRVWKNRLAGPELGVFHKAANNTDTGKEWDYPEFRGYHADLRWATFETTETPITVVTPTPDIFLRVLSWPDASKKNPGVNVARPPGNISLLHGINAIGHKFGDAASLGPEGLPNHAQGLYTGSADFFFGPLQP